MIHLVTLFFLFISFVSLPSFAQEKSELRIPFEVLNNPIDSANWFNSNIEITHIKRYISEKVEGELFLENGYAVYEFVDRSEWGLLPKNIKVKSIDLIFTKYPYKKEDWITNYYVLLSNRFKELFSLDNSLNSNSVSVRLVMQTEVRSGEQAMGMLHGFLIRYETYNEIQQVAMVKPEKHETELEVEVKVQVEVEVNVDSVLVPEPEPEPQNYSDDTSVLFPESIYNRNVKYHKLQRVKRKDDPDCPSFRTRAQKPRRSIWRILIGR
jgi:hypothetical protein